ncbi:hypothetical protein LMH87_007299 [Akanthomyces muscarius]|uniref:Uncharacterized protein n=1 Tax=Akanthomyces muscarius TaxID=2231603 RepID=A0A9W8QPF5_AKAMU|nr:hypothetical protein LMH87_007299 [Akanthomyces muscarius]KAJ4165676.1 hypothetical protein LMH87_007299 [Akanthomyces muscarius]
MKSGGGESSALFAQTRTACAGKDDENPQKSLGLLGECGSFPSFQSSEPTSARGKSRLWRCRAEPPSLGLCTTRAS